VGLVQYTYLCPAARIFDHFDYYVLLFSQCLIDGHDGSYTDAYETISYCHHENGQHHHLCYRY
jgi:hypothetical protein